MITLKTLDGRPYGHIHDNGGRKTLYDANGNYIAEYLKIANITIDHRNNQQYRGDVLNGLLVPN